jgi:predicted enzyme related to lactoylglutathione lyase
MTDLHGRFVWYELTTTDMPAAAAFYAAVVGWGTRNASMPGLPYTVFAAGDAAVCGMMQLPQDARQRGERPMWLGYICVDDVDAAADRIQRLGGAVHVPPQDVMDVSRFAIVSDPQMATFALFKWQRPDRAQPTDVGTRGHVGWHELLADDREKAWTVYSELFGWLKGRADAKGTYQQISAGGQTIGGMMTKPATVPMAHWLYYFNVGDVEAALKRVKDGGGEVLKGPTEMLDGHWSVECADPQGALFALIGRRGVGYFPRVASR